MTRHGSEFLAAGTGYPKNFPIAAGSFDHLPQSGENDIYLKRQIAGENNHYPEGCPLPAVIFT